MGTRVHRGRVGTLALIGSALGVALATAPARAQVSSCVGDCENVGMVSISNLVLGVNIALGSQPVGACPAFANQQGMVDIAQLVRGVNNALGGCPAAETPTATPTGVPTGTATATVTPTATIEVPTPGGPCRVTPGRYTLTQTTGGTLRVGGLQPFAFPAGGTVIQEVGDATEPECVHDTVVPFPGGFDAPTFCLVGLNFSVKVLQTGCGIGQIDSNGGADYTIKELGDSSYTSASCDIPDDCTPGTLPDDSSVFVEVTVGDGTPDTCRGGGTVNAALAIPVHTTTWLEVSSGASCPANDGSYDPEAGDRLVVGFPQVLDFTTDTNSASWMDLDSSGCAIAGSGPPDGFSNSGECLNLTAGTVTTAASGSIGSSGGPLYDLTFTTRLPNTISGPEASTGATCESPPAIDFSGTASRCIE